MLQAAGSPVDIISGGTPRAWPLPQHDALVGFLGSNTLLLNLLLNIGAVFKKNVFSF